MNTSQQNIPIQTKLEANPDFMCAQHNEKISQLCLQAGCLNRFFCNKCEYYIHSHTLYKIEDVISKKALAKYTSLEEGMMSLLGTQLRKGQRKIEEQLKDIEQIILEKLKQLKDSIKSLIEKKEDTFVKFYLHIQQLRKRYENYFDSYLNKNFTQQGFEMFIKIYLELENFYQQKSNLYYNVKEINIKEQNIFQKYKKNTFSLFDSLFTEFNAVQSNVQHSLSLLSLLKFQQQMQPFMMPQFLMNPMNFQSQQQFSNHPLGALSGMLQHSLGSNSTANNLFPYPTLQIPPNLSLPSNLQQLLSNKSLSIPSNLNFELPSDEILSRISDETNKKAFVTSFLNKEVDNMKKNLLDKEIENKQIKRNGGMRNDKQILIDDKSMKKDEKIIDERSKDSLRVLMKNESSLIKDDNKSVVEIRDDKSINSLNTMAKLSFDNNKPILMNSLLSYDQIEQDSTIEPIRISNDKIEAYNSSALNIKKDNQELNKNLLSDKDKIHNLLAQSQQLEESRINFQENMIPTTLLKAALDPTIMKSVLSNSSILIPQINPPFEFYDQSIMPQIIFSPKKSTLTTEQPNQPEISFSRELEQESSISKIDQSLEHIDEKIPQELSSSIKMLESSQSIEMKFDSKIDAVSSISEILLPKQEVEHMEEKKQNQDDVIKFRRQDRRKRRERLLSNNNKSEEKRAHIDSDDDSKNNKDESNEHEKEDDRNKNNKIDRRLGGNKDYSDENKLRSHHHRNHDSLIDLIEQRELRRKKLKINSRMSSRDSRQKKRDIIKTKQESKSSSDDEAKKNINNITLPKKIQDKIEAKKSSKGGNTKKYQVEDPLSRKLPNGDFKDIKGFRTQHKYIFWGALIYIKDKKLLASTGKDGYIQIWDLEKYIGVETFKGHSSFVFKLIYIEDKKWLVSGSFDKKIKVWDTENNFKNVMTSPLHDGPIYALQYVEECKYLITGGDEDHMRIWLLNEDFKLKSKIHLESGIGSLCYSKKLKRLFMGMFSGKIGIFNPEKLNVEYYIENAHLNRHFIHALYYDDSYDLLVSGSEDGYIKMWEDDKKDWNKVKEFFVIKNRYVSLKSFVVLFDKDLIIEARGDKELRFRRISTGEIIKSIKCHKNEGKGEAVVWIDERKELVTGFSDQIFLWPLDI